MARLINLGGEEHLQDPPSTRLGPSPSTSRLANACSAALANWLAGAIRNGATAGDGKELLRDLGLQSRPGRRRVHDGPGFVRGARLHEMIESVFGKEAAIYRVLQETMTAAGQKRFSRFALQRMHADYIDYREEEALERAARLDRDWSRSSEDRWSAAISAPVIIAAARVALLKMP